MKSSICDRVVRYYVAHPFAQPKDSTIFGSKNVQNSVSTMGTKMMPSCRSFVHLEDGSMQRRCTRCPARHGSGWQASEATERVLPCRLGDVPSSACSVTATAKSIVPQTRGVRILDPRLSCIWCIEYPYISLHLITISAACQIAAAGTGAREPYVEYVWGFLD